MDFDNKHDERRRWREDRRRWHHEKRNRDVRGAGGIYTSGQGVRYGHLWTGLFLVIIGCAALLKAMYTSAPNWLFTWQMLLIALGFFMGIRHQFRGGAWFILIVIGGVFLVNEFFPELMLRRYIWPVALIVIGLFFILRPRRHRPWQDYINDKVETKVEDAWNTPAEPSDVKGQPAQSRPAQTNLSEDFIDSTSIFGGVKKNVISKNFKGGDITNIMGGSEIDLTQADINGTVRIDVTQVFGGTKLVVPSNWQVKAQMAASFGGVEDKRSVQNTALDPNKILILDGTSIFGGIEIRSY